MKKMMKIGVILVVIGALLYLAGTLLEMYANRIDSSPTHSNPTSEK